MSEYITKEQKVVVEQRILDGWEIAGFTKSMFNGLMAVFLIKGRNCKVINSLGYDEFLREITWRIYE